MAAWDVLRESVDLTCQTHQSPMKIHFHHCLKLEWNYVKRKHLGCYTVYLSRVSEEWTHSHLTHQILVINSYLIPRQISSFHPQHQTKPLNDPILLWFLAISTHNVTPLKKCQFRWEINSIQLQAYHTCLIPMHTLFQHSMQKNDPCQQQHLGSIQLKL